MTANILVVEDNPDNSKLVSWILEDEGYESVCVATGEDCLTIIEQQSFDLILMDISLPGLNGKEVTRKIRQHPSLHAIPILALTAHAMEAEQQSIRESGVNGLLTKPINDDLLVAALQQHLNNH